MVEKLNYRIFLIGDSATQFIVKSLRRNVKDLPYDVDIYEADYNQIELQILDKGSDLYNYKPDTVIVIQSAQNLLHKFYKLQGNERKTFAESEIKQVEQNIILLSSIPNVKIIWSNYTETDDGIFGNFANKINTSFIYQLRSINVGLMNLAGTYHNLFINDLSMLQNRYGMAHYFDERFYVNAGMTVGVEMSSCVARNLYDIISAISGKTKKCLILDLDNTIWGGVIGDDGIENIQLGELGIGKVFVEIQLWAKELKERGIILAVCSKNNEEIAKESFGKHPDMVLGLKDIAVFVANWETKVDNIFYIQSILNIGFDSMVFIDDNPFERNQVRESIPEITVPELPEDPAEFLSYLRKCNLFETAVLSENDQKRTEQYQIEAKRKEIQKTYSDEDDFLKSLMMVSEVKSFDKYTIPRVAQLTQRSNQFNLRTKRYSEEDIRRVAESDKYVTLSFTLTDLYGDNGLISAIILEKVNDGLFVDTWIMSCRVLKRGMENFVLNCIVETALKLNINKIIGEYIPTTKNELVKDHYLNLGFNKINGLWTLNIIDCKKKETLIKKRFNN